MLLVFCSVMLYIWPSGHLAAHLRFLLSGFLQSYSSVCTNLARLKEVGGGTSSNHGGEDAL